MPALFFEPVNRRFLLTVGSFSANRTTGDVNARGVGQTSRADRTSMQRERPGSCHEIAPGSAYSIRPGVEGERR